MDFTLQKLNFVFSYLIIMQIQLSFTTKEVEQLYITYKKKINNYYKIKEKVLGKGVLQTYKKKRKSVLFFFAAVTFIITISSTFCWATDNWNSFVALWMIWGGALVTTIIGLSFLYKNTSQIYTKNKAFFDRFESIVEKSPTLEDFASQW